MKLIILTPEKSILEKEVLEVSVPTTLGIITILPNHENLVSTLSLGNISFKENVKSYNESDEYITIESGFLTTDGIDVKILAEVAVYSKDLEPKEVERLKNNAMELMKNAPADRGIEKLQSQTRIMDMHLISRQKKKI